MTTVHYERLSHWLRIWEKLLEEPKELLLGKSFANVAQAALTGLEERYQNKSNKRVERSAKSWERELLGLLEQRLNEKDPALDLLRLEHGPEMIELEQLLHQGAYDVSQIYPILDRIKDAPSLTLLQQELQKELLHDADADDTRLVIISNLLLRKVLTKHDVRHLKELPQKALAQQCSALLLGRHVQTMAEDSNLNSDLWQTWWGFLLKSTTPELVAGFFDKVLWRNRSYDLLDQLAKLWATSLKRQWSAGGDETTPTATLQADQAVLRELGLGVIQQYVQVFLHQVFYILAREENKQEDSQINRLGRRIGGFLIETGGFRDNRDGYGSGRPNIVDILASEALADATAKTLADMYSREFASERGLSIASDIGRRMISLLVAESEAREVNWTTVTDGELESLCSDWAARRSVQGELERLLKPLNEQISQQLEILVKNFSERPPEARQQATLAFWREWGSSFSQRAAVDKHVFSYLPWSILSTEEFNQVLSGFFTRLAQPQDEWLIFFRVKSINSQGAIWLMGNVTFYDPSVFDYGEGWWLNPKMPEGAALSLAKVVVNADTPTEAKQIARRHLTDALNTLSFALSVDVKAGGLKPEVDIRTYVVHISTKNRSGEESRPRSELSMVQLAVDSQLTEFAKAYDHLLGLAARHPEQLNELQAGFLRALHWYRKGRWEPDPAERFLFYWIGLEHLFAKGKSKEQPFGTISDLHLTWRNVPGLGWRLSNVRQAIIKLIDNDDELRSRVDACPDLKGWKDDHKVLLQLQKVETLVNLTPDSKPDAKTYFQSHAENLEKIVDSIDEIVAEVQHLRDRCCFKLHLLYDLRNRMVHEALPYRPDMELYAEKLEAILEDVLIKIVVHAVNPLPECTSIKELTVWYQMPWS